VNKIDGKPDPEKLGLPNLSLRGFNIIDEAKAELEKKCPDVVSCADILAFAARDASKSLSYEAIDYQVPAGRFDGKVSLASETFRKNLPPPFGSLELITAMFKAKGLDQNDMVVLSAAHSIGRSGCLSFSDRLKADNSSMAMNSTLAKDLTQKCNTSVNPNVPQDFETPDVLDHQYYKNVLSHNVLFNSDAVLASPQTKGLVDSFSRDDPSTLLGKVLFGRNKWYRAFGEAMVKMGNWEVKNSTVGEIRKYCGIVKNP
jgi:peroxidase